MGPPIGLQDRGANNAGCVSGIWTYFRARTIGRRSARTALPGMKACSLVAALVPANGLRVLATVRDHAPAEQTHHALTGLLIFADFTKGGIRRNHMKAVAHGCGRVDPPNERVAQREALNDTPAHGERRW